MLHIVGAVGVSHNMRPHNQMQSTQSNLNQIKPTKNDAANPNELNHYTHIHESNYVTLSNTSLGNDVDDDDDNDAPHQLNQSNYYHI